MGWPDNDRSSSYSRVFSPTLVCDIAAWEAPLGFQNSVSKAHTHIHCEDLPAYRSGSATILFKRACRAQSRLQRLRNNKTVSKQTQRQNKRTESECECTKKPSLLRNNKKRKKTNAASSTSTVNLRQNKPTH